MTAFGGGAASTPVSTSMSSAGGTSVLTVKNKTTLTTTPVADGATSNVPAVVSSVGAKAVQYLQWKGDLILS